MKFYGELPFPLHSHFTDRTGTKAIFCICCYCSLTYLYLLPTSSQLPLPVSSAVPVSSIFSPSTTLYTFVNRPNVLSCFLHFSSMLLYSPLTSSCLQLLPPNICLSLSLDMLMSMVVVWFVPSRHLGRHGGETWWHGTFFSYSACLYASFEAQFHSI